MTASTEKTKVAVESAGKESDIGARTDILQSAVAKKQDAMKHARAKKGPPTQPSSTPLVLCLPSKRAKLGEKNALVATAVDER